MITTRHALIALILLPAVAGAQRRGGGERGTKADFGAMERDAPPPMKLKVGDMEDASPLKELNDKRKELNLTEAQQQQLKELQGKWKGANDTLMHRLDSLRIALRPRANPSDEDRVREAIGREELGVTVAGIRANHEKAGREAMALLDEPQRATAAAILEKLDSDTDKMLRDKMGGRAGGPGGGRPRRPPL